MWLLVTGTGRCGTGYLSQVLTSVGVPCSHQGIFGLRDWELSLDAIRQRRRNPACQPQAESSWLAAPFLARPELAALTVVHLVRHPKRVMNSFSRLVLRETDDDPYYCWMCGHLPELIGYREVADKAACWYLRLNEMIEKRADLLHRVEDDVTRLLDRLGIEWRDKQVFADTTYNTYNTQQPGYNFSGVLLEDVNQPLRDELAEMSERYGYQI